MHRDEAIVEEKDVAQRLSRSSSSVDFSRRQFAGLNSSISGSDDLKSTGDDDGCASADDAFDVDIDERWKQLISPDTFAPRFLPDRSSAPNATLTSRNQETLAAAASTSAARRCNYRNRKVAPV
jgi:hypothetical protein